MICPHDHQACDNRGCRYGGCQGRPSRELVAHRDPHFSKNIVVESQNGGPCQLLSLNSQQLPGRAREANYVSEGCPEHAVEFDTSGGGAPCPYCGRVWGLILD